MATPKPTLITPLHLAKKWLSEQVEDGERCPCCTQFAKVYKRTITSTMARALIVLYNACGTDHFGHMPSLLSAVSDTGRFAGGDEAKLRYWGLIEEELERRPDGGRSGWWRVTPQGAAFVQGKVRLSKYARMFDSQCQGFVGPLVTIQDCLGERFDYQELMTR